MTRYQVSLFAALVTAMLCSFSMPLRAEPLRLVQTIPLPGVEGRIDHMGIDLTHQRLIVAALGNNTVEIVDLKAGRRLRSLQGFHEPQGIGYDRSTNTLLIANGTNGDCDFLDGTSYQLLSKLHLGDDADDIRMDEISHHAIVGYGDGALAVIGVRQRKLLSSTEFKGHPEAFAFETAGHNIYVNIPSEQKLAIIDRAKQAVIASWPVTVAYANFPMALDEQDHRLFIGCRGPAHMLVYDTTTGKVAVNVPIDGDTDDLYYDRKNKLIYASCGAGSVNVIQQVSSDEYRTIASLPTAPGARTSLFVPELKRLYVSVPHRGTQQAEIMVFATER